MILLSSPRARAQSLDDDVSTSLMPIVVVVVDNSGSSNFRTTAARYGGSDCALANSTDKTRLITIQEILSGTWSGYNLKFCDDAGVDATNWNTHPQRNINDSNNTKDCRPGCYMGAGTSQGTGLIDTFSTSVKFVLATFDQEQDAGGGDAGGYSYNSSDSFLWYDTDTLTNKTGNVGIREAAACTVEGDCGSECTDCCVAGLGYCADWRGRMIPPGDAGANTANANAAIKSTIMKLRPYGGSPIAAVFKDLENWFANDPMVKTGGVDPYAQCRRKYVILFSDVAANMSCGYTSGTTGQAARCQNYTPLPCSPLGPASCYDAGFENVRCDVDAVADCNGTTTCHYCPVGTSCDRVSGHCRDSNFDLWDAGAWLGVQTWKKPLSPNDYRDPTKIPVFVVGFNLDDTTSCSSDSDCNSGTTVGNSCNTATGKCRQSTLMEQLAVQLNTDCDTDAGGINTCRATDPDIVAKLSALLNTVSAGRTSRTRSASTTRTLIPRFDGNDACPDPGKTLFKLFASYQVPEAAIHWKGYLERITQSYDPSDPLKTPTVNASVCPSSCAGGNAGQTNFHDLLNQASFVNDAGTLVSYTRRIYTFMSNGEVVPADDNNLGNVDLDVASTQVRNQVLSCVWGQQFGSGGNLGDCRERIPSEGGHKLHGIWHSSPAVVGAPSANIASASYQTFKNAAGVKDRPTMIYFGSMGGMIHAVNAHTMKEEWAFIPRSLQRKLQLQTSTPWAGFDGNIVVRDVQLSKIATDNSECPEDLTTTSELFGYATSMNLCRWRTVLVACFRRGYEGVSVDTRGHGCVALDVTKPTDTTWAYGGAPFAFLWEFNDLSPTDSSLHNRIGYTTGEPLIGSVFVDTGVWPADAPLDGEGSKKYTSSDQRHREVAIAVIPGGKPDGTAVNGGADNGKDYWVLEIMKRKSNTTNYPTIIKRIELLGADAGLAVGGCTALFDTTGTLLRTAYCGTSAGRIAELNIGGSDPTPKTNPKATEPDGGWTVNAFFYDVFADSGVSAQPIYDAPAIAYDSAGLLTFVVGSGNPDDLEDSNRHRIAIFKRLSDGGTMTVMASTMDAGDKVIGSPVIYNDVAYLTVFSANTTQACVFGGSTLVGFQFDSINICNAPKPRLEDPTTTACQSDSACSGLGYGYTCDFYAGTSCGDISRAGFCRRLYKWLGDGTFAMGVDLQPAPATCTATVDPMTQQLTGVSGYVPGSMNIVVQTGAVPSTSYTAPPSGQGGPTAKVTTFAVPNSTSYLSSRVSSWGTVVR
ncbi:MAG: hypothetical protein HYY84_06705 [Deltaproteobacteria bacterium]|nr:hypothetical protein [Deltaproteobacteria bacterium]